MGRIEKIVEKSVKCEKCVGTVFEQKLAFELFERHFERKIDWQDLIMNQKVRKIVKKKQKQGILWPPPSSKSSLFSFSASFLNWSLVEIDKIKQLIWRNFFLCRTTQSLFVGQEETLTLFLEYLKRSKLCQLSAWGKEGCQEQSSLSTIYWLHPIQHSKYLQ